MIDIETSDWRVTELNPAYPADLADVVPFPRKSVSTSVSDEALWFDASEYNTAAKIHGNLKGRVTAGVCRLLEQAGELAGEELATSILLEECVTEAAQNTIRGKVRPGGVSVEYNHSIPLGLEETNRVRAVGCVIISVLDDVPDFIDNTEHVGPLQEPVRQILNEHAAVPASEVAPLVVNGEEVQVSAADVEDQMALEQFDLKDLAALMGGGEEDDALPDVRLENNGIRVIDEYTDGFWYEDVQDDSGEVVGKKLCMAFAVYPASLTIQGLMAITPSAYRHRQDLDTAV